MKFLVLVSASVALVVAVLVLNPDHQWRWSLWRSPVADLVVRNAKIYTSDESLPFADSMAVRNGRVLRVGNYSSVQVAGFFLHFEAVDSAFCALVNGIPIGYGQDSRLPAEFEITDYIYPSSTDKKNV